MMKTQNQADYRRGEPLDHCGICRYYLGHHRCSKVAGDISPYGLSNEYSKEKNPFGKTLNPREVVAIKAMAADAADRSGGLGSGSLYGSGRPR